ncbi:MAG: MBL fold metallo-hydrolase [Chitinophagaceae bacterium]
MQIEQIYTGCLAQGAYYIESEGEVAIIDPLREVQPYLDKAAAANASIKYVFETHFHADFVSGHLDLAAKTGATIVYGPTAQPQFKAHVATDGEVFTVGKITIKAIHTPGHTMESTCYLLCDENGIEKALFTGDTLFIGDVGRPDLAQKVKAELTEEILAGLLYDSLHQKIMPLNNDIIVYPAHGAGSACGKNMRKETTDTLGNQKQTNYALQTNLTKEAFSKQLLNGLVAPPAYFPKNVLMNIQGYESFDAVLNRGIQALTPQAFEAAANETGALIIDTRSAAEFVKGFIPNSIFIGIDGNFAPWVGTLIADIQQPILIVADEGREEEVVTRLARVGYDNCIGHLAGGIKAWTDAGFELDSIETIEVEALYHLKEKGQITIIDVRKNSEFVSEHVVGAINAPLDFVNESMLQISKENTEYIHCASGYRSVIFISILKARGYNNLINIVGGFKALKESNLFQVTDYVCPTTLL